MPLKTSLLKAGRPGIVSTVRGGNRLGRNMRRPPRKRNRKGKGL